MLVMRPNEQPATCTGSTEPSASGGKREFVFGNPRFWCGDTLGSKRNPLGSTLCPGSRDCTRFPHLTISPRYSPRGALRAIFDLGIRCPGEIALVSFDDLEWFNYIQPRVSAVAQPTYELGARAAERLLRRISEEQTGPPERETLTTELWVRESSVSTWDH